jgi:hypothetical protein
MVKLNRLNKKQETSCWDHHLRSDQLPSLFRIVVAVARSMLKNKIEKKGGNFLGGG